VATLRRLCNKRQMRLGHEAKRLFCKSCNALWTDSTIDLQLRGCEVVTVQRCSRCCASFRTRCAEFDQMDASCAELPWNLPSQQSYWSFRIMQPCAILFWLTIGEIGIESLQKWMSWKKCDCVHNIKLPCPQKHDLCRDEHTVWLHGKKVSSCSIWKKLIRWNSLLSYSFFCDSVSLNLGLAHLRKYTIHDTKNAYKKCMTLHAFRINSCSTLLVQLACWMMQLKLIWSSVLSKQSWNGCAWRCYRVYWYRGFERVPYYQVQYPVVSNVFVVGNKVSNLSPIIYTTNNFPFMQQCVDHYGTCFVSLYCESEMTVLKVWLRIADNQEIVYTRTTKQTNAFLFSWR
jgi:hypothetical protein